MTSISEEADILDHDQILDQTCSRARSVGEIQKANLSGRNLGIATKSSGVDLVTEVDHYSEQYLITALRHTYPQHAILSEEQGQQIGHSGICGLSTPGWNHQLRRDCLFFSISIALQYRGQTVMGVVYAPVVDQIFTAIRGKGAFLNGKPIAVSKKTELGQCVLATGFPYDRATPPITMLTILPTLPPG